MRNLAGPITTDRESALRKVPLSSEMEERLAVFVALLARWRRATRSLISERTLAEAWTRHIADSAQLTALAPGARRWVDMGSGAGFPGLVIGIQLAGVPEAIVHCFERDRRKCAFMREVVRATGSSAEIHASPVEAIDLKRLGIVTAITARALATLPMTVELAKVFLNEGAVGVFPRGHSTENQIRTLTRDPAYSIETLPSTVDAGAAILRIRKI